MDWVAVLGPGGVIALLVVIDRIIARARLARKEAQQTVLASWRDIASEQRMAVQHMQRELDEAMDTIDYWRARSGHAEYLLRLNHIPHSLPASIRRRRPAQPPAPTP